MSILLISDIHLSIKKPNVINSFLHFLNNQAIRAQSLYILGDLFDIWLGDDNNNITYINIANSLKTLSKKKIPCYFIRGNRDFLLGKKYADLCGIILLPDNPVLTLPSGKNIIILHGDSLCTNDKSYQLLKKILHNYFVQQFFLSLPLFVRLHFYNILHTLCIKYNKHKLNHILNIDIKQVITILMRNQSLIMIHGHTHQIGIYNIQLSTNITLKRVVLGSWDNKYGSMVEINEKTESVTLIQFPLYIKKTADYD